MIQLNGTEIFPTVFPDGTSQVWKLGGTGDIRSRLAASGSVWSSREYKLFSADCCGGVIQ